MTEIRSSNYLIHVFLLTRRGFIRFRDIHHRRWWEGEQGGKKEESFGWEWSGSDEVWVMRLSRDQVKWNLALKSFLNFEGWDLSFLGKWMQLKKIQTFDWVSELSLLPQNQLRWNWRKTSSSCTWKSQNSSTTSKLHHQSCPFRSTSSLDELLFPLFDISQLSISTQLLSYLHHCPPHQPESTKKNSPKDFTWLAS